MIHVAAVYDRRILPVIFADAFIPLSPVTPIAQLLLLAVIVLIEGKVIRSCFDPKVSSFKFWRSIFVVNLATTVLGLLLVVPLIYLDSSLAYGWGNDGSKPVRWWTACILFGFVIPWLVWFLCYQISWRVENALLKRGRTKPIANEELFNSTVRRAHRWSYLLLAVPLIATNLWYGSILYMAATFQAHP